MIEDPKDRKPGEDDDAETVAEDSGESTDGEAEQTADDAEATEGIDTEESPPEEAELDETDAEKSEGEETEAEDTDGTSGGYDSEPTVAAQAGWAMAASTDTEVKDVDAPAPEPEPETPEAREPEPRGGGFARFLAVMIVLGVIVGGGYASWPYWSSYVKPYLPEGFAMPDVSPSGWFEDERVTALLGRVGDLETAAKDQSAGVQAAQAGAEAAQAQGGELATRLGAVEAAATEQKAEIAATIAAASAKDAVIRDLEAERTRMQQELGGLMTRMEALEQALKGVQGDVVALTEKASVPVTTGGEGDAAAVTQALQAMSTRIGKLENAPAAAAPSEPVDLSPLQARLDKLESAAAAPPPPSVDPAVVADLAARLAAVEQRQPSKIDPAKVGRVVAAVEALRGVLRTEHAFAAELAGVKDVGGGDSEIDGILAPIEPLAAQGIPSLGNLRKRFGRTSSAVVNAGRTGGDDGLVAKTLGQLSSLISIRRTDEAAGDGPAGAVASAEKSLAAGDLGAAVKALEALKGPPAEAAAPWLADARHRLAAERSMAALHVRAVSLLTGSSE